MTMKGLCPEDRAIINSLFNPLLPLGEGVADDEDLTACVDTEEDSKLYKPEARRLNTLGVTATEAGRHEEALQHFREAISLEPEWGAPFNNRAQLYRILRRDDDAIADLDVALRLSDGKGTVCCQASLQRASLHRLRGEDDQARELYKQAEKLGSPYAKTQLVALNPMSALCNKMLVQMMTNEQKGITSE